MSYLRTPDESPLFHGLAASLGYVPNYARPFAHAPEAFAGVLDAVGASPDPVYDSLAGTIPS